MTAREPAHGELDLSDPHSPHHDRGDGSVLSLSLNALIVGALGQCLP